MSNKMFLSVFWYCCLNLTIYTDLLTLINEKITRTALEMSSEVDAWS